MHKKTLLLFAASALLVIPGMSQSPASHFDGRSWWDHIKFLADDKLEGRETGSDGLRKAEAYVVEQLEKSGLVPAGNDGYYQKILFSQRQIVEKDSNAALVRDGKATALVLGEDCYFNTGVDLAAETDAPLVFVGYGLNIPETHYNDFDGLEVKGKVVVLVPGSPSDTPTSLSAHYQSRAERYKALRGAGAIGMIYVLNPAAMDIPWSRISANRAHPTMDLVGAEFDEAAGIKFAMTFNPANAEKLFAGTGHTFEELAILAKDRKPMPHFAMNAAVRAHARVEKKFLESANVVGKLTGSDPKLKNEYVVLSAHVDHIGIGEPIGGDAIYNGAMDNASGTALLLDLAASLKSSPEKMKRSVLFVFVTAEEKGLLGSKYFAAHPTVDAKAMAADINTDMFLPIVPLKLLTVYGLAESDLGDMARDAAQAHGVKVQADPEPLRNFFIRSDQYNFIRHGIPSLAMGFGAELGSPEQQKFKEWRTNRYHAPSDDVNQPVDLAAAAGYEEIIRSLLISTANGEHRPQWKPNSFFRRYAESN